MALRDVSPSSLVIRKKVAWRVPYLFYIFYPPYTPGALRNHHTPERETPVFGTLPAFQTLSAVSRRR